MLAGIERHQRGHRMRVIGGADHNGIDVRLLEEFAKVGVGFGLRKIQCGAPKIFFIDVAKSDDVLVFDAGDVRLGTIADTDDADVQPLL
jgi:hypothetical protein